VIFVFGSNLAGRHGKGAALYAKQHYGAVYGNGVGPQGSAYAIPTKRANLKVLPLEEIQKYVEGFITYAQAHPTLKFQVTRVGCGLAGFKNEDIAPLFKGVPSNCEMPVEWAGLY
jgi:hypothetical protein